MTYCNGAHHGNLKEFLLTRPSVIESLSLAAY